MVQNYIIGLHLLSCFVFYSCSRQDRQFTQFVIDNQRGLQEQSEAFSPFDLVALKNLKNKTQYYSKVSNQLDQFDYNQLNQENRALYNQLTQEIETAQQQLQPFFEDASIYNFGGILKRTLTNNELPLEQRLQKIEELLEVCPTYYQLAKENLIRPNFEKIELAIHKQILSINFLFSELSDSITHSKIDKELQEELEQEKSKAKLVLKDYLAYCESLYFEHRDSTLK